MIYMILYIAVPSYIHVFFNFKHQPLEPFPDEAQKATVLIFGFMQYTVFSKNIVYHSIE